MRISPSKSIMLTPCVWQTRDLNTRYAGSVGLLVHIDDAILVTNVLSIELDILAASEVSFPR